MVIVADDHDYPKTKNVLAKTKNERLEKLQVLKESCGGVKSEKLRPEMPVNKLTQNGLRQFYARLKKNGQKRFADLYGVGLSERKTAP